MSELRACGGDVEAARSDSGAPKAKESPHEAASLNGWANAVHLRISITRKHGVAVHETSQTIFMLDRMALVEAVWVSNLQAGRRLSSGVLVYEVRAVPLQRAEDLQSL